jgi:hypothetical protein
VQYLRGMRFSLVTSLSVLLAVACVAPREGVHSATPIEAAVASGMAANELARSKPEQFVLGWKLDVIGDRARFFSCTAEDTCGERLVEVPAKALLAVKIVGRARPLLDDGVTADETDVLRFTIANDVTTSRGGVAADPHRGLTISGGRAK